MKSEDEKTEKKETRWDRFVAWAGLKSAGDWVFAALITITGLMLFVLVGMLGWMVTYSIFGDQTARYCYLEQETKNELTQTALNVNRGWGMVVTVGVFENPERAIAIAKEMNCEIK